MGPLHYHSSRSDFGFEFLGDIRNQKTTPRIGESGSRQDCLELPFFFKPLDFSIVIVNYISGLFFPQVGPLRHGLAVQSYENRRKTNFFSNSESTYQRYAESMTPLITDVGS